MKNTTNEDYYTLFCKWQESGQSKAALPRQKAPPKQPSIIGVKILTLIRSLQLSPFFIIEATDPVHKGPQEPEIPEKSP